MVRNISQSARVSPRHNEWLHTFYTEAWKQYSHEDNLYQSRSTIFLGLHTALIGILIAVTAPLVSVSPIVVFGLQVSIGHIFLGFFAIVFAMFGIILSAHWKAMTNAARAYLSLRLSTARIIEFQSGLEQFGLVGIENRWSAWSKENWKLIADDPKIWYGSGFYETSQLGEKKEYQIRPRPNTGGFDTHLSLIKVVAWTWYIVGVIGLLLILGSLIYTIFAKTA